MREEKVNSSGTVYYVGDGENVLIETDANLITQAHYTDFPGMWGGLNSVRRGGVSSFYGFDQQSNTRILASMNGNVTDDYLYKAFGEELAVSGSTINSLRFGGQVGYWRDEAERLYVRRRVLRVDQGRWISREPIGFDGGDWNLYRYSINTPIDMVDPSGMQAYSGYRKPCSGPTHSHGSCFWCWYERGVSQGWPRDDACAWAQQWCHSQVPCKPYPPDVNFQPPPIYGNQLQYPPFPCPKPIQCGYWQKISHGCYEVCMRLGKELYGWDQDCCDDLCDDVPDEDDEKELCVKTCEAIIAKGNMPPPNYLRLRQN